MISGLKTRLESTRRVVLTAMLLAGVSAAWGFEMPDLDGLLAKQKSGEARFTEQRFVRGMDGPLESSGTLSFSAPDKLTRRTLTPRPESMTGSRATPSRCRAAAVRAPWRSTAFRSCSAWSAIRN